MDWSKAKTILIIAFIITNLLLAYVTIGERNIIEPTFKDSFIKDVRRLLEEKGISISTQIPKKTPNLYNMIVEYEEVDIKALNKQYLSGHGTMEQDQKGLNKIVKEYESILVLNNRLIVYENKNESSIYNSIDENEAIQLAKEFIKKGEFQTNDMVITFVKKEGETFYIEFSEVFNGIFIETAFTNLQIDKRGVKRFERLWLKQKQLGDVEIRINTAPKSILALLGMQEIYGKNIIDISLCYYFDPEKHEYLGEPKEARQGNAIPAWRIQFDDGYKIFIDEY